MSNESQKRQCADPSGRGDSPAAKVAKTEASRTTEPADTFVWVKVKGALNAIELDTAGSRNVYALLKKVREEVKPQLDNVPVNQLTLYQSEERGKVLSQDHLCTNIKGNSHNNPLYVHYDEPAGGGASSDVHEAVARIIPIMKENMKDEMQPIMKRLVDEILNALRAPSDSTSISRTQLWKKVNFQEDETAPDNLEGDPVVAEGDLANLAAQGTEKEFNAAILPFLKSIFFGLPDQVIDSQNHAWDKVTFHGMKPGFFRAVLYQQIDGAGCVGTPYPDLLDCLNILEGKLTIDDSGRGQLYEYLCALPTQHARGMIFDRGGFELLHVAGEENSKKAGIRRMFGKWSKPGTKTLIRDFFLQGLTPAERLMRKALAGTDAQAERYLGRGTCGRVLQVLQANESERCAMKLVLADHAPQGFTPQREIEAAKMAFDKECPVVEPLDVEPHSVYDDGKLLGWYYRFRPVGSLVDAQFAKSKWRGLLCSLRALHRNDIAHGDARLPNVIHLNDKFLWIDFMAPPLFSAEMQKCDVCTLVCGILNWSLETQLELGNFDEWLTNDAYIDNVLGKIIDGSQKSGIDSRMVVP